MSISKSKSEFNELFERKYNAKPIQLELEFNEDINEVKVNLMMTLTKA